MNGSRLVGATLMHHNCCMGMINKYVRRAMISEANFRDLVGHLALDLEAIKIAILMRLNRNTVNHYLLLIRQRVAELCEN